MGTDGNDELQMLVRPTRIVNRYVNLRIRRIAIQYLFDITNRRHEFNDGKQYR